MKAVRVGLGFDVHRFSSSAKPLVLGGIEVSSDKGLSALSDGDVVLHAIADAILGASALGDIGDYFPPTKKFRDLDSKKIIEFVLQKIKRNFKLLYLDITIIAEKPKLAPHKERILTSLRDIFGLKQINLKIKSKEGLDILGKKNAISCLALAQLEKK